MKISNSEYCWLEACAHTLVSAYQIGLTSLVVSVFVGLFWHPAWVFSLWGLVYFVVLRQLWHTRHRKLLQDAEYLDTLHPEDPH